MVLLPHMTNRTGAHAVETRVSGRENGRHTRESGHKDTDLHDVDVVFPRNNERALLEMAQRLGTRKLILVYELTDPMIRDRKGEVEKLSSESVRTEFAVIAHNQQDVSKAVRLTRSVIGTRAELAEDSRVAYLMGLEDSSRDDFIHHRRSGMNQVVVAHANRTNKTIFLDLSLALDRERGPVYLGRLLQNTTIAQRRFGNVIVVSGAHEAMHLRAPRDRSLFLRL
jgi:RNase P/RNase MRP subunit p30